MYSRLDRRVGWPKRRHSIIMYIWISHGGLRMNMHPGTAGPGGYRDRHTTNSGLVVGE